MISRLPWKNKSAVIVLELFLWIAALGTIAWLWDRWMLAGPHGPYRWIGMDFAPFWVGVREMFHSANPYDPDTTLKIQQVVYGGPALGNDPMMFVYPAWMFILVAPLSLLPFQWAAILYVGTLLWGMLNVLYLISRNLSSGNFNSRIFWMMWLTLGSLPFLIISVTKGQLGYFSLIALFLSRRIWSRHPYAAGIILGLALIKPTVTVIPTAGYLLWALFERDWKFLAGFLSCFGVLSATSLLAGGNWISGYLAMLGITGGMPVLWSIDLLSNPWKTIYAIFFGMLGIYAFLISRRDKHRDLWLSSTFLVGIALFPMRWIYDLYLGILIPPEEGKLTRIQSLATAFAVASPWALVFLPAATRWNTAIIGLPLIWTACLLSLFAPRLLQTHPKIKE
jgi:hypothetical protein